MRRAGRHARGLPAFTLVEVLVATAVLAIGLLGALTAFSMASRVSGIATNDTIVTLLAHEKLAEIQLLGPDGVPSGPQTGDFGPDYPGYRWRLFPQRPNQLNVVPVDLVIIAPEAGREREIWFSTNVF
jgi:prepilin-type N-terminal cleavage/methylation domain-containing protein